MTIMLLESPTVRLQAVQRCATGLAVRIPHFTAILFPRLLFPRVAQRAAKGKEIGFTGPFNPLAWRLSGEKHGFRKRR
jgi:hypothetical protein